MPTYTPPLRDMQFVMHEVFRVADEFKAIPRYAEADAETINAVLEEAGKFAAEVTFPLNGTGDVEGCTLDAATHEVRTPAGFKEAYAKYVEAGWPALSCDPEWGGQGLPLVVNQCFYEMLNSANQSWTMYPGLTHGAYAALSTHGTDQQKRTYLPRMTSGEWTGTMCLTEAHCGTDLGLMRTKAEPQADGSYRITGNKIFISAGEHDLAQNIIHLVLARLPDAPPGIKGISLFIVPKFLVNADGSLGARNPIFCGGLEHKMGIHGNATAQINIDGATGWMVGQPNKGMQAMFVMMNAARLGVGNQSLGLTEVAYQNARAYAKERIQMRSLSGPKAKDKPADPIIVHPDVRRMLLTAKAYAEGGRALLVFCSVLLDKAHYHPDEKVRKESDELLSLLTPIAKAFTTDNGHVATNACLQVFGGHGYIHEWGMEQFARDNRINMIYEGTNTIQSLDLLGRKILGNNGATLKKFGKLVAALVEEEGVNEQMAEFINPIAQLGEQMTKFTTEIGFRGMMNADEVGAAAVDYLRVAGHLVHGYLWARMAQVALREIEKQRAAGGEGHTDPFYGAKLQTARFYFAKLFPETAMLMRTARAGAKPLMDTDLALA
ncbi:acyl-CoA dehydrogenase C-terminal domain-containing protein [Ramlibacter sp.]|uniref:acyl-CoA dehydrogenase C-terminal domain-containing protein n=1 Tax=Ramlibacter sp. TaxID=1917967 RepID=UPI002C638D1A|nr:acyl-CoA dehydrogenase C-terminal domain-containing protein [Ramlibacter sp.]HWI84168.1 acyl-CoA dehydrogenase C-terminal domain-containing protein [Ramlibacter sp.]